MSYLVTDCKHAREQYKFGTEQRGCEKLRLIVHSAHHPPTVCWRCGVFSCVDRGINLQLPFEDKTAHLSNRAIAYACERLG